MKEELATKLTTEYPEIFGDSFYFECGDGWYELLNGLCGEIVEYCRKYKREAPKASQVKEKFGSLRFYIWYANEDVYNIIDKYELQSQYICEFCGKPGRIKRVGGWYSCVCGEHLADWYERREKTWSDLTNRQTKSMK